ncbi:MAG: ATP-binding protein, partial [Deltaproteobacteria bacterium]|nr:ATP-binding protein [Deltaproteobacteria bacterium]
MPLGVTEERLLGGLDFERTLRDGTPSLKPGILGEANNGLVYIDEVNLLDPSLAHLMLDAVSSGRVLVERDGFSCQHPARVALLGSMNPEEGPLGPQLADRFAMTVELRGEGDPALRALIVRRRLEYEADPVSFRDSFREESRRLSEGIAGARAVLPALEISPEARACAAALARAAGAAGHRADISLCLAARARAAWESACGAGGPGREGPGGAGAPPGVLSVGPEWVFKVEGLVIPVRRRAGGGERAARAAAAEIVRPGERDPSRDAGEPAYVVNAPEIPPEWRGEGFGEEDEGGVLQIFRTGEAYAIVSPRSPREAGPREQRGRRGWRETLKARGRAFRTTARRLGRPVSLSATLRAAAPRQRERAERLRAEGSEPGRIILTPADFREKVFRMRTGRLVLFLVDSSGSIGTL